MVEAVQPETSRINPDETAKKLRALVQEIDGMTCGPDARPLMDFVQDKLLPFVVRNHDESVAMGYYLGQHEDRLGTLEEQEESQLLPEDAEPLLAYLHESVEVLDRMAKEAKVVGLDKLVARGKKAIAFVEEITLDDDDEEGEEADDN